MYITPIESLKYPGFFEIPWFNGYLLDVNGRVINKATGNILQGSRNPAGYINYRLKNNKGSYFTIGRHRLLCYVFKNAGIEYSRLYVNHKNGIKGDDRLENLEWCTPTENIEHAGMLGLSKKCFPVAVRDYNTGEVTTYPSFKVCGDALGLSKDAISYRVGVGEHRVFPDGRQYRLAKVKTPWVVPDDISVALAKNGTSKAILRKDVGTGEIVEFKNLTSFCKEHGVSPATMSGYFKRNSQPAFKGMYRLKLKRDSSEWVDESSDNAPWTVGSYRRTIATEPDGSVVVYNSAKECCKARGISASTLSWAIGKNGYFEDSDGVVYTYGYGPA